MHCQYPQPSQKGPRAPRITISNVNSVLNGRLAVVVSRRRCAQGRKEEPRGLVGQDPGHAVAGARFEAAVSHGRDGLSYLPADGQLGMHRH